MMMMTVALLGSRRDASLANGDAERVVGTDAIVGGRCGSSSILRRGS